MLRQLRQDAKTGDIPVIAVTANAMPRDVAAGQAAGFSAYLVKPLQIDKFHAEINKYLPSVVTPDAV